MSRRQDLIPWVSIILLAVSGNVIWLSEILYRFGWASLGWLRSTLYAPYLLASFPAFAFFLPFLLRRKITRSRLLIVLPTLYSINILFYWIGDKVLRIYLGKMSFVFEPQLNLVWFAIFLIPFTLLLPFGLAYFLVLKFQVARIRPLWILFFVFIILAVFPFSWRTYIVIPINEDTEWFYNSIKAGYPVFWTIILMGVCGWVIEKNIANKNRP